MSVQRQNKLSQKKAPDVASNPSARRTNAWGRNSPNVAGSPPVNNNNSNNTINANSNSRTPLPLNGQPSGFPPLTGSNQSTAKPGIQDAKLQAFNSMIDSQVMIFTRTGQRHQGTIVTTTMEGEHAGVNLKDVKDLLNPNAPLKVTLFIAAKDIEGYNPIEKAHQNTNGSANTFRTDTDISANNAPKRDRTLEAWQAPPAVPQPPGSTDIPLQGDDVTFGDAARSGLSWDQFAANEEMFGVTTSFDENIYTTKIDRNRPDFKERERKAQLLADEIMGSNTSNPHMAEERNQKSDDSGMNEEDKYGAVVRSPNAYIPPGARRANPTVPAPNSPTLEPAKQEIPKVLVKAPEGGLAATATATTRAAASPAVKAGSPPVAGASNAPTKGADGLVDDFRSFVTNEKVRLTQKKQVMAKNEMDKRKADLLKWSQSFKLNKPIPDDLVPILAKDEEKRKIIREKSKQDAASANARSIGASITAVSSSKKSVLSPPANPPPALKGSTPAPSPPAKLPKESKTDTPAPAKGVKMVLQSIPPFNPNKVRGGLQNSVTSSKLVTDAKEEKEASLNASASAASRLNINASSFKPNPNANSFKPSASTSSSSSPQNTKAAEPPAPPNPFFGTRVTKKSTPVHIKDDFNPFKGTKPVPEASSISYLWPYTGKRYMQVFGPVAIHPPAQMGHMQPPPGPPPPQAQYDEDPSTAAPRGGFVYYAPYPYPGQPHQQMMPGMPPPPGSYMHAPYIQTIPYPPNMPPPNGPPTMYGPPMGAMPLAPHFIAPPPGAYPPPNGAGPRPSIPPTPVPAHAHPYPYHQSPQIPHAAPYPMIMQPHPGPNGPQHGYEGAQQAPPVALGNHS